MEIRESFGPHLILDLSKCNTSKLKDISFIYNILYELPPKIGMTRITQPYVFPYSGLIPEDKGITGIVILAESHASIHTFEEKGFVFADLFSCKSFDIEKASKFLIDSFEAKKVTENLIYRGANFPREKHPLPKQNEI